MSRFPHVGRRPRAGAVTGVAATALSVLLAGCSQASNSGNLTPDAPSTMTVTSMAFSQGVLPLHFTCRGGQGKNTPPLDWTGAPANTKSYAIVVDDGAAPITPYIYWIVFDIPQATTDIQAGQLPPGARQASNSLDKSGYDPPCPDGSRHRYRFTVYALDSTLNLPQGTTTLKAWSAIADAAIARGRVTVSSSP